MLLLRRARRLIWVRLLLVLLLLQEMHLLLVLLVLQLLLLLLLLLSKSHVGGHGRTLVLTIDHMRLIRLRDPCHLRLMLLHCRVVGRRS